MDFSDKQFVITGASSGIGHSIALKLAQNGANVLAIARRELELNKLHDAAYPKISVAAMDVRDDTLLEKTITDFVQKRGKLDGSVHSAGTLIYTPLRMFNQKQARQMMDVCFWSGVSLLQIATNSQFSNPKSSHVQISSVSAHRGQKGLGVYCAVKAAIIASAKAFSKELAKKEIRINTISPGIIKTDLSKELSENFQYPLGEGTIEDVVNLVLFLLSSKSRWITGTDIIIDGGYLA